MQYNAFPHVFRTIHGDAFRARAALRDSIITFGVRLHMQSKAATVPEYLAQLDPERRAVIQAVRQTILKNLDRTFEEGMQYCMIGFYVPHSIFPAGYHCDPKQPLPYAGLASQKNACSLYLMSIYAETSHREWFIKAWTAGGRKLDMGKSCIRFKSLEEVPLDVVGEAIRRMSASRWIEIYEQARANAGKSSRPRETKPKAAGPKKAAAKKPALKSATKKTAKKSAHKAARGK